MPQDQWTAVDRYLTETLLPADDALEAALKASDAAGLPQIAVAPNQGKLLQLMARSIGAARILEIGTLGGYSTIWLARALPKGGRLITLEASPKHAKVAGENIAIAGSRDVVDIRVGPALETLPKLVAEGEGPFDMFFLDADKPNNPAYFEWALKLARPGSVIVADNVVRLGALIDDKSTDPNVKGVRHFMEIVAREKRVSATAIQTVGVKGHDGFAIAIVNDQ